MLKSALLMMASVMSVPAVEQRNTAPVALPDESASDDIIVTALRIPREKLPTSVYWDYQFPIQNRIARENAQQFLRCALKTSDVALLRKVVDGEPNGATGRFAQGWIRETHSGCYPPRGFDGIRAPAIPNTIADVGDARLDRGIIVESVMKSYAPDAVLNTAMTMSIAVQNRFQHREGVRNRLRLPADRDGLIFSACLVKSQPVFATRLFNSAPGSALERGLIQAIIVGGRECVGRARSVTVDPSLTRGYIIDAFYRWVVAARDMESLIPADA